MTYTDICDVRGEERIDSRDLIELALHTRGEDRTDETAELLAAIDALAEAGIEDWEFGAHFIREDTFEDHARELADDIGAVDANAAWPYTCIDWACAARELAMDYTSVSFLGHDYYVR